MIIATTHRFQKFPRTIELGTSPADRIVMYPNCGFLSDAELDITLVFPALPGYPKASLRQWDHSKVRQAYCFLIEGYGRGIQTEISLFISLLTYLVSRGEMS